MFASTDYVGIAALITSAGTIVIGVIVAIRQAPIAKRVDEVHAQVTPSNGETLADITEANDLRYLDPANPPTKPKP